MTVIPRQEARTMKAYRVSWQVGCVALVMVGVSVAVVVSPAVLASLFLAFAVVGAVLTLCVVSEHGKVPRRDRARVVRNALVAGTTASAFIGLVVLLGAGVFLLGLLVLVSSPYAVDAYGRWLRWAPTPSAAQLDALTRALAYAHPEYMPVQLPAELGELTDEQLCRGWRASYLPLRQRPPAEQLITTVEERQRYLDEFERRNASGFAAWLASGARAPGNPLPYLIGSRNDHPTINWDELIRGQDW